jgi:hypothetical protein
MALLDETRLTAERARRAKYRLHHVGTKLNEGELREFEALAAKRGQTQAELIRGLMLEELKREAGEGSAPMRRWSRSARAGCWWRRPAGGERNGDISLLLLLLTILFIPY